MPYAVEHITLPLRFMATMAHLVATLTIVFDLVRPLADDEARGPAGCAARAAVPVLQRLSHRSLRRPTSPSARWGTTPQASTSDARSAPPRRQAPPPAPRRRQPQLPRAPFAEPGPTARPCNQFAGPCLGLHRVPPPQRAPRPAQPRAAPVPRPTRPDARKALLSLRSSSSFSRACPSSCRACRGSVRPPLPPGLPPRQPPPARSRVSACKRPQARGRSADTIAHLLGAILVALFVQFGWQIKAFDWIFTLFSLFPALVEMAIAALVLNFRVVEYV